MLRRKLVPRAFFMLGVVTCISVLIYLIYSEEVHSSCCSGSMTHENCVEHHIVFILGGYKTINLASALFKSLLFHHRGPLVFHFIVDDKSGRVLPTLFDTWELPSVRYHTYNMEPYKKLVDWVPSTHYSSVYGLLKLVIPDILPKDVKEVLFLDTDLVILNDISPIFEMFKGTNESVMFAMGENISPRYLKRINHWPARGRGLNSGVALIHLERMRKANWNDLWRTEAKMRLKRFRYGGGQDIFNAITVSHPDVFFKLPCEYNFQLGRASQPETCQTDERFVKIVHFNSEEKTKMNSTYVAHFARIFEKYQSMDGYMLRLRDQCEPVKKKSTFLRHLNESDSECIELIGAIQTKYRTHLYFNGVAPSYEPGDITLVTQLSVDGLDAFKILLNSWEGPVSAAIYCTDDELVQIETFMQSSLQQRNNVALHVVSKTGNYFPLNYLRNVARNASNSDSAFLADVDVILSIGFYRTLHLSVKYSEVSTIFVVPEFEMESSETPRTREDVVKEWNNGNLRPYKMGNFSEDSNTTLFDEWKETELHYKIIFNSSYELSTVIDRARAPNYDERLVGQGWSDASVLSKLQSEGFKFLVVPNAFIIRKHPSNDAEVNHIRLLDLYRKCVHVLKSSFANDPAFLELIDQAVSTGSP